jgi:hypothetical protein
MISQEAAAIIAIFHGAYPRTDIDDAVTEVWMNTLLMADYEAAMLATQEWIDNQRFWPTVAEFNTQLRNVRQRRAGTQIPRVSAVHCDGSGWFDRGIGWEPCSNCNPWNYELIKNGDWNNTSVQPPASWVQPRPCNTVHHDSELFSFDQAKAAIERGYREHHENVGTDRAVIQKRLDDLFRAGLTIGAKPV